MLYVENRVKKRCGSFFTTKNLPMIQETLSTRVKVSVNNEAWGQKTPFRQKVHLNPHHTNNHHRPSTHLATPAVHCLCRRCQPSYIKQHNLNKAKKAKVQSPRLLPCQLGITFTRVSNYPLHHEYLLTPSLALRVQSALNRRLIALQRRPSSTPHCTHSLRSDVAKKSIDRLQINQLLNPAESY